MRLVLLQSAIQNRESKIVCRPFGDPNWVTDTAKRLGLECMARPRGRTEETIVGLPRLLVLSVFSRSDSPDLVAVTFTSRGSPDLVAVTFGALATNPLSASVHAISLLCSCEGSDSPSGHSLGPVLQHETGDAGEVADVARDQNSLVL